jgi:ABC-type Fe3+-hydroxamate transport system substrate-binding protein
VACGPEPAQSNEPFGILNDSFPLLVHGWDGAQFTIETVPRRILPLNAGAVDALVALTGPERLVALPSLAAEYSTFPADAEAWLSLPQFSEISAAAILAFEPDLVIGHEWQAKSAAAYLRQAGVAVLILPMPTTFDDVSREIDILGRVIDASSEATALLTQLERRRAALRTGAEKRSFVRVLGYSNYGTGGWAAGADTTCDITISLAGMRNAARDVGLENFNEIDYELLLRLDPDLILVEVEEGGVAGPTESLLLGEAPLKGLSALSTGGLVRLPRRLNSTTSLRMLDAAERLADAADKWLEDAALAASREPQRLRD